MNVLPTPLTMRVPTLVTKPFKLSERWEERARVEPYSVGARREAHSSRPALRDFRVSWRATRSHSSSLLCLSRQMWDGRGWPCTAWGDLPGRILRLGRDALARLAARWRSTLGRSEMVLCSSSGKVQHTQGR
jgi:hypothetical protein